jgi:hypothetical protein
MITGRDSVEVVAAAWWLLSTADRDPDVARLLDHLVGELRARLSTLAEDKPSRAAPMADQLQLLARMSRRYAAGERCHPAAAWMLAAIHRLTDVGGYLHAS